MELSEEARRLRNAYARQWRRRNPDKVRKINNDYWERQALKDVTDKNTVTDTSVTPELFPVTEGKKCLECGRVFESKRMDAKFCSPACKQKHYRNN